LSGRAAAARLKLSAATGVRWLRRLREQGDIRPDAFLQADLAMNLEKR